MTSNGFATVGQAIEHHARADTHKRKAAMLLARHGSSGYQSLAFGLMDQVTRRLADHYRAAFDASDVAKESRRVALYANSSPEYVLTLWALMRAGFVPACLSPRNSVEAVGHLASKARASVVVRGRESNLVAATDALRRQGAIGAAVDIVSRAELQSIIDSAQASPKDEPSQASGSDESDPESVALILHSSGSTGTFLARTHARTHARVTHT
jgi:acyl-CoA synthetase (AMP-forming)/AMP-acid ligase II